MSAIGRIDWTGKGSAEARTATTGIPKGMHMFPCTGCGEPVPAYRPHAAACEKCKAAYRESLPQPRQQEDIDPNDIPF